MSWIGLACLAKIVLYLCLFLEPPHVVEGGDTEGYFGPIESLLQGNGYQPDYRLPGYGAVYFVTRTLLDAGPARAAVVILQWLLSVISVYYLAKSVWQLTRSRIYFYVVFCLYAVSSFTNIFDNYLLTESLAISSLIFCVYHLTRYFQTGTLGSLAASGFFFCWLFFMKPVVLPVVIIAAALIIWYGRKEKMRITATAFRITVFAAPLLAAEVIWTIRNYRLYHEVIPVSKQLYTDDIEQSYHKELMEFVMAWGGDRTWWNPPAEIRWFTGNGDGLGAYQSGLPAYIYTSAFTPDSLELIRHSIAVIDDSSTQAAERATRIAEVKTSLSVYTASIRKEKPLLFYFGSRILLLKKFLIHSGTQLLFRQPFGELNFGGKILKIFYSGLYYLVLASGLVGMIMICRQPERVFRARLFIPTLTLYFILVFPLLGHVESRYLALIYPFMLVCASFPVYRAIVSVMGYEKDLRHPSGI